MITKSDNQKTRYLKLLKNGFTVIKNRDITITSDSFDSYKTL